MNTFSRSCVLLIPGLLLLGLAAASTDVDESGLDQQAQIPPHIAARMMAQQQGGGSSDSELPKFEDVAKDFEKVVSTADGKPPMYHVWTRERDGQVLAELPRNYESQQLFIAYTITGGVPTAGVQFGDTYAKWKRYDRRLALIEPNIAVRTTGDLESQKGRSRVYTDRVILDIPIAAEGPNGGIVINMTDLLVGQGTNFFGNPLRGINRNLVTIETAKAFPNNIELGYQMPLAGSGRLASIHYSISVIPESTGYRPRKADNRVGYFTTTYRDIGDASKDTPWVRYINRWHLEKADPSLKMSPPKEPIVFYLEHTTPVRYRRWVREGVLEWNKAFEKVGIINAIEVYQQDARTGAHMEKDPADARYNFVLWTNAGMGFAIGPSRVDPRTGQILDADVVLDEGFITSWARAWRELIPEMAMEGFGPETYNWLESNPQWDPRVRLAAPAEREAVMHSIQAHRANRGIQRFASHPVSQANSQLMGSQPFDGLVGRVSQVNGMCMHAMTKSLDVAILRLGHDLIGEIMSRDDDNGSNPFEDDEMIDGVPESFIGPLLRDLTMHEIGHVLGLRHNFKASGIYTLEEINSPEHAGKAMTGSVMDYNPINVNMGDGEVQGDFGMMTIGPYDYWAIEYGYTFENDLSPILARVSEPELAYLTDEDTWGPDPMARRFDLSKNPLDYAESQMRLVNELRSNLLDRVVEDGDSWSKARRSYEILLGRHFGAASIAANWIGGSNINRDHKGDPGDRAPIENISADQQRRAMQFVIDNIFDDDAFGLNEELLSRMTVDKWWDEGGMGQIFSDNTWPVHDRIQGIQASALTMMLNPTTLNRVYDNEFRIDAEEDALTLPEVIFTISDAIWQELDSNVNRNFTARQPMISSLRRNLQSEHLQRLIDLSMPNRGFGAAAKPVSNLSVFKLREIKDKIDRRLENPNRMDPYSIAHLDEARSRISRALDAQYIYNTDAFNLGGGMPMFFFQEDGAPQN